MYFIKIMYAHVLNKGKKVFKSSSLLLAKSRKQSHLPKQERESDVVICSDDKSSSSS